MPAMQSASPRHANARTVSFEISAATAAASSRTMATNHADTRDIRLSCDKSVTGHRTFSAWNPRTRYLPRRVDCTAPGCRNIAALTFLPRSSSSSPTPAPRQGRGPAPLTRTATVPADPTDSATGRSIRFRGRRRRRRCREADNFVGCPLPNRQATRTANGPIMLERGPASALLQSVVVTWVLPRSTSARWRPSRQVRRMIRRACR